MDNFRLPLFSSWIQYYHLKKKHSTFFLLVTDLSAVLRYILRVPKKCNHNLVLPLNFQFNYIFRSIY